MAKAYVVLRWEVGASEDGVTRVECFWLSILPIPCGVIDKLYSIYRLFVWMSKHPPVSSVTMCLVKEKVDMRLETYEHEI